MKLESIDAFMTREYRGNKPRNLRRLADGIAAWMLADLLLADCCIPLLATERLHSAAARVQAFLTERPGQEPWRLKDADAAAYARDVVSDARELLLNERPYLADAVAAQRREAADDETISVSCVLCHKRLGGPKPEEGDEGAEDYCDPETHDCSDEAVYVNVYKRFQVYGGPEEGGWYGYIGEPLESVRTKRGAVRVIFALKRVQWFREQGTFGNKSVLDDGELELCQQDHFAKAYDTRKGGYE